MKNDQLILAIKEYFQGENTLTATEIKKAIIDVFPNLSDNTVSWRINQLKKEKLIFQVGRGVYSLEYKPEYFPEISLKTKRLYNRVNSLCPKQLSVWDTEMIFSIAETDNPKHWVFLSTNKEDLEPLFNNMLDFSRQVFLQPDKEVVQRYIIPQNEVIILTPFVSETPLCKGCDYLSPSLEGLLVNVWLKADLFFEPIGFDVNKLFKMAFEKFTVNQSKLLRYAARRDKREEIEKLIKSL